MILKKLYLLHKISYTNQVDIIKKFIFSGSKWYRNYFRAKLFKEVIGKKNGQKCDNSLKLVTYTTNIIFPFVFQNCIIELELFHDENFLNFSKN